MKAALSKQSIQSLAASGLIQFPSRVRAPEPIKAPPQIQRAIDEWKKQETFAQICLKHGVNYNIAQNWMYGRVKKQPKP